MIALLALLWLLFNAAIPRLTAALPPPPTTRTIGKAGAGPVTEVSSVHRAAGVFSGSRPDWARKLLRASWFATDRAVKAMLEQARTVRRSHSIHVTDANRGMTAADFHPDAVLLFADRPDYGVAVPALGWRVNRELTRVRSWTIGLEAMHRGHVVRVVFDEINGTGRQVVTVAYGNIGRAGNKAAAKRAWHNFRDGFESEVDVVCVVEVAEGDSGYNERDIYRVSFDQEFWIRFWLKRDRNPIAVRRRETVEDHTSDLVGKPVPHWSPPRRLNAVFILVAVTTQKEAHAA